ncbi:MAG TPA: DUF748 domain-containing protein [Chryseolinea sp.]|nr:DUF748 domain-containing protein [Chryseolinea sp.]
MTRKVKTIWIILGSILLLLVVGRLMLPYFVTRYVNKVLANIEGYEGSISDVDIHLMRGAYSIHDLKLFKVNGHEKVPFIDIATTDLSVEWPALFKGSLVGEVIFEKPQLNFIGGDGDENKKPGNDTQTGENVDWTKPIKELMPLQINRLEIVNGSVFFYDFTTKPKVDIHLDSLQLIATNLNNAENENVRLPSNVIATARSLGGGKLSINMDINVLKEIPDLDLNLKFEQINMPALNDFFVAYSKVDIERGTFNLYSELVVKDSKISGYVKPLAQNIKIVDWDKDKENPINLVWQGIVSAVAEFFENQKEDQFATKVPLEGNLENINSGVWPTIWNVFRNAFVQAFARNTDNTVKFSEQLSKIENEKPAEEKSRKEKRREKRKERKEERERKKEARKRDDQKQGT